MQKSPTFQVKTPNIQVRMQETCYEAGHAKPDLALQLTVSLVPGNSGRGWKKPEPVLTLPSSGELEGFETGSQASLYSVGPQMEHCSVL